MFRYSIDNTFCCALTVMVKIYKALWSKRLKIGLIKKQQRKRLEKRKKLDGKNFRVSRIFCNFANKNFREFECRLCLGRNFREKSPKKRENRETFCP